jgi:hypothetical protein
LLLTLVPSVQVGASLIRQALPWRESAIAAMTAALLSVPLGTWMASVPLAWPMVDAGYAVALLLLSWLVIRTDQTPRHGYASADVRSGRRPRVGIRIDRESVRESG